MLRVLAFTLLALLSANAQAALCTAPQLDLNTQKDCVLSNVTYAECKRHFDVWLQSDCGRKASAADRAWVERNRDKELAKVRQRDSQRRNSASRSTGGETRTSNPQPNHEPMHGPIDTEHAFSAPWTGATKLCAGGRQPHGYGKYTFPNGQTYVGDLSCGVRHGKGRIAFPTDQRSQTSDLVIEGNFQNGCLVWGTEIYTLGQGTKKPHWQGAKAKYVGAFKNDNAGRTCKWNRHGQGKLTVEGVGWFEGEFRYSEPYNGKGRLDGVNIVVKNGDRGRDFRNFMKSY